VIVFLLVPPWRRAFISKPLALNRPPEKSSQAGLVERVKYHNVEDGFCVIRITARGHRDVVTVVGPAATIAAHEWSGSERPANGSTIAHTPTI
jgi:hypothetical protein